jgi:uncharacterized protein involved in response to NO
MQTRGEQMLALRRARLAASPPFLRGGFRPFFFGGAAWAIVALLLWLAALSGTTALPSAMDSLAWHRHEMLFGFVGAIICGFLLTAIPNWTGRLPIAGMPLAALFALWLAARLTLLFSGALSFALAVVFDVGFYLLLAGLFAREILSAWNRNLPIVGLVFLFGIASALDHAGAAGMLVDAGTGYRAGIMLVVLMISLIGGRIVPSFTRNWLAKRSIRDRLPGQPTWFDLATIAITGAAMVAWTAWPHNGLVGPILVIAGIFQALRLSRWQGWKAAADPLVLILHVGYAWVPVGLSLLGASMLSPAVPVSAAIHALTAGAMATMILAVMTRATLGHTGRDLRADAATIFLYLLVTSGAALRVTAPFGWLDFMSGIALAGLAWAGAFIIFLLAYGPMLLRPRVDGRL